MIHTYCFPTLWHHVKRREYIGCRMYSSYYSNCKVRHGTRDKILQFFLHDTYCFPTLWQAAVQLCSSAARRRPKHQSLYCCYQKKSLSLTLHSLQQLARKFTVAVILLLIMTAEKEKNENSHCGTERMIADEWINREARGSRFKRALPLTTLYYHSFFTTRAKCTRYFYTNSYVVSIS
jgi:hypothetical protein